MEEEVKRGRDRGSVEQTEIAPSQGVLAGMGASGSNKPSLREENPFATPRNGSPQSADADFEMIEEPFDSSGEFNKETFDEAEQARIAE